MERRFFSQTEKTHENLNRDKRSPGRDLNPKPPEYEGVLASRPRHLVSCVSEQRKLGDNTI
jgi:hypothetical protein